LTEILIREFTDNLLVNFLGKALCQRGDFVGMRADRESSSLQPEIERTQVVVFAGGMGKRMGVLRPKALMEINGQTLVDRCIETFKEAGFRRFVFLLGYGHDEVVRHIGDGREYDIHATFSVDSTANFGRGKAMRHALESAAVQEGLRTFVTFPDDIFVDKLLPRRIILEHLRNVYVHRAAGSIVLAPGMRWPYGTAAVDRGGRVRRFIEKPFVSLPTSIGNYVFEPSVHGMIRVLVDLSHAGPVELEATVIPKLAAMGKLRGIFIPHNSWIPVNTQKDLETAERIVASAFQDKERPVVPRPSATEDRGIEVTLPSEYRAEDSPRTRF
jgi:NDP-sugar pyrophosphorylase family protein